MIPSRENNSKIAIKIFIHSYYGGQPEEYRCCLVCGQQEGTVHDTMDDSF